MTALPNVECKKAYIKQIRKENDQIVIALDYVELFWGDEATKASKEDGFNGVFESHGSYIRNNDPSETLFSVPDSFIVYVLNGSALYGTCIRGLLSDEDLSYSNGYYRLFNVMIVGNRITAIEEQYRS